MILYRDEREWNGVNGGKNESTSDWMSWLPAKDLTHTQAQTKTP